MRWSFLFAAALATTPAWAGPPAVVHTKVGVFYGELVERVEGDHITLQLATGAIKRFAWKEIDPTPVSPLPSVVVEESVAAPHETVRTKTGAAYHGETIEHIPNDHITIVLATGEVKRIDWSDVDTSPPPPPRGEPRVPGPIENVVTKNGSIYHGEILEKIVGVQVTVKLSTGDIKTIDWEDIDLHPVARLTPSQALVTDKLEVQSEIHFSPDKSHAILERTDERTTICTGGCTEVTRAGFFRVAGNGVTPSDLFVVLGGNNAIEAHVGSQTLHTVGAGLLIASAPTAALAVLTGLLDLGSCGDYYCSRTGLDFATGTLAVLAGSLFFSGLVLLATQRTNVTLNGRSVGRIVRSGFAF